MFSTMPSYPFSSPFQPSEPSPLSSSPIRASSTSPPPAVETGPLAPTTSNCVRLIQSSPILGNKTWTKTKYATRQTKPNPLRKSREGASDTRRRLFLDTVRQRRDDQAWERRGGDQEILKQEWTREDRRLRAMKNADADALAVTEDELEDILETGEEEEMMMVDDLVQQEEQELDAMLSSYEERNQNREAMHLGDVIDDDDDDYDSIFVDLLSTEQQQQQSYHHKQLPHEDLRCSGAMDIS